MLTLANTKSYLSSKDKDEIRTMIVENTARNCRSYRKPVNLKYLTLAAAEAIEANMMAEAVPDIFIHAVECNQREMLKMVHNGPYRMMSQLNKLETFIEEYQGLPSGYGDPRFDGHFAGINLDWYGWLTRARILATMNTVYDHRFVKPGGTTIIAETFKKGCRTRTATDASMALALAGAPGAPTPFYSLESADEYTVMALTEACPALEVKRLHKREYRNRKGATPMFFLLYEVKKPVSAPVYPSPSSRIERDANGIERIGSLVLPGDETLAKLAAALPSTFRRTEAHFKAFDALQRQVKLKGIDLETFDHLMSGRLPPRANTAIGLRLNAYCNQPQKAAHLKAAQAIRSDYGLIARYNDAA